MNVVIADNSVAKIGYQTENGRTQVRFDLSDIMTEFPGGYATLAIQRPCESNSVLPSNVTMDGDTLVWTVSAYEIEHRGILKAQILYTVNEVIAKTKVYKFQVDESIRGSADDPPSEWRDWVDEIIAAAGQVHDAIDQAQAELNAKIVQAELASFRYPRIIENIWYVWDVSQGQFVSTGIQARGDDGNSPIVTVEGIPGGIRITVTDLEGEHVYDNTIIAVQDETPTDPSIQIWLPETLPAGVDVPTYSEFQALGEEVNEKADKTDTVLETTLSRGRKANTYVGYGSLAFGYDVEASGTGSVAEGTATIASGTYAHASGNRTTASAPNSHAEGLQTIANHQNQHVFGSNNVADPSASASSNRGNYVEIVGNGIATNARSNARALDWSGNEYLQGDLYVNCNASSKNGTRVATLTDLTVKLDASLKGSTNGLAELDQNGRVPASQLPAYVDDVVEYESLSNFPATGETGKIYVAKDTNVTYRWSGSSYVVIGTDLALGETSETAYRGDRGAYAYEKALLIDGLEQRIADLEYVPIELNSLSVSPNLAEIGSTSTSVTLAYSMNRDATQMKLDGSVIANTSASGTIPLTGLSLTSNKTWTLQATDERLSQESQWVSKTATLTFTNKVKYGAAAIPSAVNDTFLNNLPTRTLSTGKVRNFTVTAGAGQYIWYALPTSYGACSFTVGGFTGGFQLVSSQTHINESGAAVQYDIYRSDNANLGATSVSVS